MERMRHGVLAGLAGGVVGGVPSTAWALMRREDPLAAARAAGVLLSPGERRASRLLAAAVPVHLGISVGWGIVLAFALPRRGTAGWGAASGLLIAAVSLRLPGRRAAAVRELALGPQVADHVAFAAAVGATLAELRRRPLRLR